MKILTILFLKYLLLSNFLMAETLPTKSKLVDMINNQEVLPKRLRKWVQKIN